MASYTELYDDISGPAYDEAGDIVNDAFDDAMDAVVQGNAQGADQILEGLGMSIEEREKWFGVVTSTLSPWMQMGQEMIPDVQEMVGMSKEALRYAQDLVFDADAIYGTDAWKSFEGVVSEAITNSASAKSGLLSGNTLEGMRTRIGSAAIEFRNNEIRNAQNQSQLGMNNAVNTYNMAYGPTNAYATAAYNTGNANANAISQAYNTLGEASINQGINLGNLYTQHGNTMANMTLSEAQGALDAAAMQEINDRQEDQGWMNMLFDVGMTAATGGFSQPGSVFGKSTTNTGAVTPQIATMSSQSSYPTLTDNYGGFSSTGARIPGTLYPWGA